MSATSARQEKERNAAFWACRKGERHHVRVGQRRQDGTQITLHGSAAELHGPNGLCSCCHGRAPQTPQPAETAPDVGTVVAPTSVEPEATATPAATGAPPRAAADRVTDLIHPNVGRVVQYRGADTLRIDRVRAAMHRFRPGQPLTWGTP